MAVPAISPSDIKSLKDSKYVWSESEDKSKVLKKDFEKIIHSPEFRVLGFLNGYMFASEGIFLSKSTLDGKEIAKISIDVDHGTFYEGCKFFYIWHDNVLTKVSQNLEIDWSYEFDLNIKSVTTDCKGDCYILFEQSRTIRKFLNTGEDYLYIDGSDDSTKEIVIHDIFVTKGAGWLYVLGTEYWDYNNKAKIFIDKYNTRTWVKTDRLELYENKNISIGHPDYTFKELTLSGDYYYLVGNSGLYKVNIKGMEFWRKLVSNSDEEFTTIEYSDNKYTEFLHYAIIDSSINGYEFGKMGVNGKGIWYVKLTDSEEYADFNWAYYQTKLYTSTRAYVKPKRGYILSLDDDRIVFHTRDRHLVKIVEWNDEEIYSADNYYGMRLLADQIKDGIDKIVYHPLRHDDGDMVNEDEDLILLPEENEHYTDADNYNYWYLLATHYKIDPPDLSILFAKGGNYPILTRLKNVIKTKYPVISGTGYEYITDSTGNRLDTNKDLDIIRSRYKYAYDKYLLADMNMFSTDIITKLLGYTIITKKNGHNIIMKTRQIYSYVLTKYSDIDLLSEWLKENGVMDSNLPKYVEELKHHTLDAINDIQVAGTPQIYDVGAYKQFEYTYDGFKYPNNTWGTQIFSCTNLPWDKRHCVAKIYIDSLANCIKKQEMRPILFFLNGKAIPWSDCTIVRDWSYCYLLIANHDPFETELSSILFPCDVRYGEDNNVLKQEQVNGYFYFDKDGKSLDFNNRTNTKIRMEVIDANVWGSPTTQTPHKYTSSNSKVAFEVLNKPDQVSSERNMIVFENNLLFHDGKYYMREFGKDVFTYDRYLKEGSTPYKVDIKAFYWIKANSYYGIEEKVPNQELMLNTSVAKATGNSYKTRMESLYTPFNFKMYRDKSYEQNIADAVSYIMKYDSSLLIQYWKDMAQTKSYTFNGEYLINRVPKDGGWLLIPRARKSQYDDYIIVFRNNKIYEYYKEIDYTDCYFKIPIFNHVERTDTIEILHIKECDNNYYTLKVSKDKLDYLPENLRYDNFLLFGNSPSTEDIYIPFNRETSIQYDIGYNYRNIFDERGKYKNTEIKLDNEFYYGKEINICSKRQFHYMYYNIFSAKSKINLSPDFRFCHDKSRYMVYIDGVRIPSSMWELNIMSNEVQRKYISIEFYRDIQPNCLIEIFYLPVPVSLVSEYSTKALDTSNGVVVGNLDELEIPFDKDLFFVEWNYHKINIDDITNINKNTFKIRPEAFNNTEQGTSDNRIMISTYMRKDILLSKLWSYTDLWSNALEDIRKNDYSLFLDLIKKKNEKR